MASTPEVTNGTKETIKIGTTGTISSLMSQELESVKDSSQASSSTRKKLQTAPVSVPCGYTPKRAQPRRSLTTDPGSSSSGSSSSNNSGGRSPPDTEKPKPRRSGHGSPILNSEGTTADKNTSAKNAEKKKGHTLTVEVVDLKCNNPMSSRLKKLGFSKLSESIT